LARKRPVVAFAALGVGFLFIAAACGSSSKSSSSSTSAAATTASSAAGSTSSSAAGGSSTSAGATPAGGCSAPDTSIDATEGTGAGQVVADLTCAQTKPVKAVGDPIVIGFQNHEGDPNGSFPEFRETAQATVDYINNELGGLGGDVLTGKAGRPIKLDTCAMAVNPADSIKCANQLIGDKPFTVVSALNFFGNHFPIYAKANVSVLVGTPITVGDFTSPNVYALGTGGGCLGAHTGVVKYAAVGLGAKRIAVPWSDTPPGVVCYYDLEKKPLDVLQGAVKGTSPAAGSIPSLVQMGVAIKPANPDDTPQVTQILNFKPDAIVFSAQGADCYNLIDTLKRLGWTPAKIPLILTGACIDVAALKAEGDAAKGIYFQGSAGGNVLDPSSNPTPRLKLESSTYNTKMAQYKVAPAEITKGFSTQGFYMMMTIWEQADAIVRSGQQLTPATFNAALAKTHNAHAFFSVPIGCADAPTPYVAICAGKIAITQWDGATFKTVKDIWDGTDLIAGTQLKPGP